MDNNFLAVGPSIFVISQTPGGWRVDRAKVPSLSLFLAQRHGKTMENLGVATEYAATLAQMRQADVLLSLPRIVM